MTGLQVWLHPSSRTKISGRGPAISGQQTALDFDLTGPWSLTTGHCSYTLLLFGGLHPLCGIGVTSRMERTSMPDDAKARTADSRPEPGPLTRTSTLRTP